MIEPIFILSLPRSGSTLLQKMLAAHPMICTTSEPWFLLPLVYALRERGTYAIYDHGVAREATLEFLRTLGESGIDNWYLGIRELSMRLYEASATHGETYFLDKTPRYLFIADELRQIFPKAKFVFLFRNPLAVLASIIEKSGHSNRSRQDLYLGFEQLVSTYSAQKASSEAVRYEDLVRDTDGTLRRLCGFLDIAYSADMKDEFSRVKLDGKFGDKSTLETVSSAPLERWKRTLSANPIRKRRARKYLEWIGAARLKVLGYDFEHIIQELDRTPTRLSRVMPDVWSSWRGRGALLAEPDIARSKLSSLLKGERIYRHR